MTRKTALSKDKLLDLGAEKLAQLVLDEAERNTGFRRQVKAAIAGAAGPEAVAQIIDRRLSGLKRAKSFIDWDKARGFADDLDGLTDTITAELGSASPSLAIDRLLGLLATHEQVFERVDDSSGHVQDVYYQAIAAIDTLAKRLTTAEADQLPEKIMAALGESTYGYLASITKVVAPHLPQDSLARWDANLDAAITKRRAEEATRQSEGWFYSMTAQWSQMRQTIALGRGDLDLLVTLEAQKKPHVQDVLMIAEKLLEAGRTEEALEWVRKPGRSSFGGADGILSPTKVQLEARILDAGGDKAAAQDLRWRCFEEYFSADTLREYLKRLPDFDDIEAEENAFTVVQQKAKPETGLRFFLDWPRPDLAAQLVVSNPHHWDGAHWYILPDIAATLEHEYPAAATVLYRALLDDILDSARSKAYRHGATYLANLDMLASAADLELPDGLVDHTTYVGGLKKKHSRKYGFWTRVDGEQAPQKQQARSRRPAWVRRDE